MAGRRQPRVPHVLVRMVCVGIACVRLVLVRACSFVCVGVSGACASGLRLQVDVLLLLFVANCMQSV